SHHPHTLSSTTNLAAGYWSIRRFDQAIPLLKEALKQQEATIGRTHPDTLLTIANLGVNYKDAGRLDEALPLLEEVYRASKQHGYHGWVEEPLLDCYVLAGKSEEAVSFVTELLGRIRELVPAGSQPLANSLAEFAPSLLRVRAFADAERLLRE